MKLYVDGQLASEGQAKGLISKDPAQAMEIGTDARPAVGNYTATHFTGVIDEVRLYFHAADEQQIAKRFQDGSEISSDAVLAVSFDDGSARDLSLSRNHGTLEKGQWVDGKFGKAIQFSAGKQGNSNSATWNSLVDPKWTQDVPIYVRAMVLAGPNLFIAGPPDIIDEEETFQKLTENDEQVQQLLAQQDAVLGGKDGGLLLSVNIDSGEVESRLQMDTLPAWDGLAGANGKLFLSTLDGSVICFAN
jgi:hypothetical protein